MFKQHYVCVLDLNKFYCWWKQFCKCPMTPEFQTGRECVNIFGICQAREIILREWDFLDLFGYKELKSFEMRKQHICLFNKIRKMFDFYRNANMLQRIQTHFQMANLRGKELKWAFEIWFGPSDWVCRDTFEFEWGRVRTSQSERERACVYKNTTPFGMSNLYSISSAQPHYCFQFEYKLRFSFSLERRK